MVQRICCVCRQLHPTNELIRVARFQNEFAVQTNRPLPGRGAYVCPACLIKPTAVQSALCRSFKTKVPPSVVAQLVKPQ